MNRKIKKFLGMMLIVVMTFLTVALGEGILIKNVKADLETIDNTKCIKDFDRFLTLHSTEISKLQKLSNLSSVGV